MSSSSEDSAPRWRMITREMPCRFATGKNRRLAAVASGLIEAGIKLECHYITNSFNIRQPHDPGLWQKMEQVVLWKLDPEGSTEEPEDSVEDITFLSVESLANSFTDQFPATHLEGVIFTSLEMVASLWNHFPPEVLRVLECDELESGRAQEFERLEHSTIPEIEKRSFIAKGMFEKQWIPRFDLVALASAMEVEKARKLPNSQTTKLVVWPNVVPDPGPGVERCLPDDPSSLFVGHLGYPPNQDALVWFVKNIFPLILKQQPAASLRVIGQRCPESLARFLEQPNIDYLGAQPTLDEFYASATAAIVPLRAGTGTRIKILEAFSFSCPVVSTSKGAEGLELEMNKEILIADDPSGFAESCLSLHDNPALGRSLAEKGLNFWKSGFTHEALNEIISTSLKDIRKKSDESDLQA